MNKLQKAIEDKQKKEQKIKEDEEKLEDSIKKVLMKDCPAAINSIIKDIEHEHIEIESICLDSAVGILVKGKVSNRIYCKIISKPSPLNLTQAYAKVYVESGSIITAYNEKYFLTDLINELEKDEVL